MNSRCACFLISNRYHGFGISVTMRWTRRQESKDKNQDARKKYFIKKKLRN